MKGYFKVLLSIFFAGAGKTIVAAYVIKHFLETCGNSQKSVLFFTPGSALAQQQHQRLEDILPKDFR